MEIYEALEIAKKGKGTGRWRMTVRSTEDKLEPVGLCKCEKGHKDAEQARQCKVARDAMPPNQDQRFDDRSDSSGS